MSEFRFFIAGPPRTGTCTLIHALFRAGVNAYHCADPVSGTPFAILLFRAFLEGRDPLFYVPRGVEAMADMHLTRSSKWENISLWPTFTPGFLPLIREHYPECWIVLNHRPTASWVESITRWKDFRNRIVKSDLPFLPCGEGQEDDELAEWFEGYLARTRAAFAGDKRFIDLDITDPKAPEILSGRTGLTLPWWGKRNANPPGEALPT